MLAPVDYLSGPSLEPLVNIIEHMYKAVQVSALCIVISIEQHGTLHIAGRRATGTLSHQAKPSALARRLSDEVSDNRHGQRWTSADTHGRSAAGHACCDAGSPCRDLAS